MNGVFKNTELDTCALLLYVVKLSKFIHPSTDGLSARRCVVHLFVSRMATVQERTGCVEWLFEIK